MNIETALAHLEAFIAGGDELCDVPEDDAIEALQSIRETLEKHKKGIERLQKALEQERNAANGDARMKAEQQVRDLEKNLRAMQARREGR